MIDAKPGVLGAGVTTGTGDGDGEMGRTVKRGTFLGRFRRRGRLGGSSSSSFSSDTGRLALETAKSEGIKDDEDDDDGTDATGATGGTRDETRLGSLLSLKLSSGYSPERERGRRRKENNKQLVMHCLTCLHFARMIRLMRRNLGVSK